MGSFVESLPPQLLQFLVFLFAFIAIAGMFYALLFRQLSGRDTARRRLEMVIGGEVKANAGSSGISEQRRKQSIEKALNEMAQREHAKQRAKMTLKMRLNQADLNWSPVSFYTRHAGLACAICVLMTGLMGVSLLFSAPLAFVTALICLNFYVKSQCTGRMKKFVEEFPNAIDIVTRGVKTGLPLGDCLRAIATDGQEPVRSEFQRIVEDMTVGLTLAQALNRFTQRVPITEANFFAVVLTIQGQLGGNLSEALGNLSRVLRDRKMMKEKIKAFSSEATASGAIIASMPVAVAALLSVTSPDYIGLLFSQTIGNVVLFICAVWMSVGIIVMRNMIRFDF